MLYTGRTMLDPSSTQQQDRALSRVPVVVLLLLSAAWAALVFVHSFGFIEDDAYIHLEFARSLAQGHGFSFNGHVVYGDTAPLWVLLLVAVHAAVSSWELAAKVLGTCGLLFASAGAFAFARKLTGDRRFAAWMVLLFVLNPYVFYWSFSGMETVAAAGLAFWLATLVADRDMTWTSFLATAFLAGLGPLLRPEMLFLTAIVALVLLYRWVHVAGPPAKKLPAFAGALAFMSGPSIAWAWYALHTFGRMVPNTNAAKRASADKSIVYELAAVYGFGYFALAAVLAGMLLYLWRRRRQEHTLTTMRTVPIAAWVFVAWSAVNAAFYVLNHTQVQTRYLVPSASGLLVCGLAWVLLATPRALLPLLAFSVMLALVDSVAYAWPNVHNKVAGDRALADLSRWVTRNLPPDAAIALYPIGEIAFLSQHPVVDTGGIMQPSAIPYMDSKDRMNSWLRGEGAQYWLAGLPPEPGSVLVHTVLVPVSGWPFNPRAYFRPDDPYNLWKLPARAQP